MKNLFSTLSLVIALLFATNAQAQIATGIPNTNKMWNNKATLNYDSINVSSAACSLSMKSSKVTAGNTRLTLYATGVKVSGTVNIKCVVRGSSDNTNFVPVTGTSADTFSFADVAGAQSHAFKIGAQQDNYYELYFFGSSGTQRINLQGSIFSWP